METEENKNNITYGNDLTVKGNLTVEGTLLVRGKITAEDVIITGTTASKPSLLNKLRMKVLRK